MPRKTLILTKAVATLLAGLLIFLGLVLVWVLVHQLMYTGRVFPGVSVAGVDLSGMSPADGALKLSQRLAYPTSGKVIFRQEDKAWATSPVQLGLVLDASTSARAAYNLGRTGSLVTALSDQIQEHCFGHTIAPVLIFDQRVADQYLQGLAQQVDQPLIEATLQIDGTNVTTVPGQVGRIVNIDATLAKLSSQLQTFRDGDVSLATQEFQPSFIDLSTQAQVARAILLQPLQLTIPDARADDPGPWVYQPDVFANLLEIQKGQDGNIGKVHVSLNSNTLEQMLAVIKSQVDRLPANARFHFDESTGQLVVISTAKTGRSLDISANIEAISDALPRGEHSVPLIVTETQLVVADTATAQQLGLAGCYLMACKHPISMDQKLNVPKTLPPPRYASMVCWWLQARPFAWGTRLEM